MDNIILSQEYRSKPLVLAIDDDTKQLEAFEQAFEKDGRFETIVSESPAVGIQLAKECRPSVVVLDIMMPMYDGGDVERMIHQCPATRDLPVILRSSLISLEELNEEGFIVAGGDIMTSKSADFSVLLNLVSRVLRGENLVNLAA